jgi:Na+-transporting NADH:ubiquinone oxidoreductase subunit NqrD
MLGGVTAIAGIVAPEAAGRPMTVPVAIALMALPALALLGAGLAPTAVGSRVDAMVVGVALAIGAPVAAALSTAIAVFLVLAMSDFDELAGPAVGEVIRMGVISALRVAPLLAIVAVLWVIVIRVLERRGAR